MPACKSIYEPQEDSTMLERCVNQFARGNVLDIGTGSGLQAITAAQNNNVMSVLATDVQKGVIDYCKKNIKNKKIKFLQSDLFENIKEKFDTIIFNPPYLPQELKLKDLTIEGGKKGYEIIQKFINEVNKFLNPNGIILMVFSSLTKKDKVDEFIRNNLLDFEELEKVHLFFEDIYVYLLRKSELLKRLENKNIKNILYLTKGRRGILFTCKYKNKKAVIKTKNMQSKAIGRIENEAKWLRKLNRYKIGPKLLAVDNNYFVYEYIDGDFIVDFLKKSNKNSIKKVIKKIFSQLFALDNLKADKEEMHHPLKHIIIRKNNPYLIDFERAHIVQKPKNVTQFCQFIINKHIINILENKGIIINRTDVIQLAKVYKTAPSISNLQKIINLV